MRKIKNKTRNNAGGECAEYQIPPTHCPATNYIPYRKGVKKPFLKERMIGQI